MFQELKWLPFDKIVKFEHITKSFFYTGVIIWNVLPENIKKSETFANFNQFYIKKHQKKITTDNFK